MGNSSSSFNNPNSFNNLFNQRTSNTAPITNSAPVTNSTPAVNSNNQKAPKPAVTNPEPAVTNPAPAGPQIPPNGYMIRTGSPYRKPTNLPTYTYTGGPSNGAQATYANSYAEQQGINALANQNPNTNYNINAQANPYSNSPLGNAAQGMKTTSVGGKV